MTAPVQQNYPPAGVGYYGSFGMPQGHPPQAVIRNEPTRQENQGNQAFQLPENFSIYDTHAPVRERDANTLEARTGYGYQGVYSDVAREVKRSR